MAPLSETSGSIVSTLGFKLPAHRDDPGKSSLQWLDDRRDDDGAEGLWRIHDKLYDFEGFVDRHPGGAEWLKLTKGTDITEAFECHHISPMPSRMLEKFLVRTASAPRHSPFTFHKDGFYSALRRRAYAILNDSSFQGPSVQSRILIDMFVTVLFVTSIVSAITQSTYLALISGTILALSTVASHNFFHLRENFRRYYFDLCLMSSTSWRVSHALSHHLFANTVTDLEISLAEPFLHWLPRKDKTLPQRYLSWLSSPLIYSLVFPMEFIRRLAVHGVTKTDIIPFLLPAAMVLFAPQGHVLSTIVLWLRIIIFGSFVFGVIGFNAAHHHPDIFHDGDKPREDLDWGLAQLDAVRDRSDISGVVGTWAEDQEGKPVVHIEDKDSGSLWTFFKIMTTFGHHSLHHMFPSIDHAHLHLLYPALAETLTEFRVPFKTTSSLDLFCGQFRQLSRNKPNQTGPVYLPDKSTKSN